MDSIKSPFLILYIFFFDERGGKMGSIQRNVEKNKLIFGEEEKFLWNLTPLWPVLIASDNISIMYLSKPFKY